MGNANSAVPQIAPPGSISRRRQSTPNLLEDRPKSLSERLQLHSTAEDRQTTQSKSVSMHTTETKPIPTTHRFPIGSSSTKRNDKDRVLKLWCSWCFQHCNHGRTQKNFWSRNVYKCQNCIHRTLPCRGCSLAMARGHGTWDDALCASCDHTIDKWSSEVAENLPQSLQTTAWCSWCVEKTVHDLRMARSFGRDSYMCQACGGRTYPCTKCTTGFTRKTIFSENALCLKCQRVISDWNGTEANRQKLRDQGDKVLEHFDPYRSVFPLRPHQKVKWLVDGHEFYSGLADAIEQAHSSIYMAFWHFNSFIYLRREKDGHHHENNRIDKMLIERAQKGVQIYLILWRENIPQLVNNFSKEMKRYMASLHSNIHCLRHGHPKPMVSPYGHHQKFVVIDHCIAFVGGLDVCLGRYDTCQHKLTDVITPTKQPTWPGVDYYNPHMRRPPSSKTPFVDVIDRESVPRMPWHDVNVQVYGESAYDLARNFVERWNHHREALRNDRLEILDLPTELEFATLMEQRSAAEKDGTCLLQVIRSMDKWSGSDRLDRSYYGAYMEAISAAEHYIYVENQYLSSNLAGSGVENRIGQQILEKLREKIRANQVFRVYFVLPQPEETGDSLLELLRWQYATINRGGSSLLEQLRDEFPTVSLDQYVGFFFLRQYDFLKGIPVTEKVFCHTKLMIVDDKVAIVGSANFNDRSFLGTRDSELGVTIEDETLIDIEMDGIQMKVGKFVHEFRLRLWKEHLGLLQTDELTKDQMIQLEKIRDPISSTTFREIWFGLAEKNTKIFETVFPGIPRNEHTTLKKYKQAGGMNVPVKAVTDGKELAEIQGFLTLHPIGFLLDEDMATVISLVVGEYLCQ